MAGSSESFKERVHGLLRTSILDAAWERASDASWVHVRIADIAEDVGVSRQTVYNEFGTKDQLSMALFEREIERHMVGIEDLVARADRLDAALRSILNWLLSEADHHRLLKRMVTDSRAGGDVLVPVLTVRADRIIKPVRARLVEIVRGRWPDLRVDEATIASDLLVRFVLSQIVCPSDLDRSSLIEAMVGMAVGLQIPETAR
ncbi:TetR family transcriptional regulator [Nocardioides sp. WS12]|uniref:TetR/AcrR family transcriptional regulator n=1 Tax=Nocardioides sp. WS12 TaxID=2486272 RepID=UPI0015FE25B4|nr:TetR family transcriptional regulator [Nocardioides sp. WS12]